MILRLSVIFDASNMPEKSWKNLSESHCPAWLNTQTQSVRLSVDAQLPLSVNSKWYVEGCFEIVVDSGRSAATSSWTLEASFS
jgi:hypothetical protein